MILKVQTHSSHFFQSIPFVVFLYISIARIPTLSVCDVRFTRLGVLLINSDSLFIFVPFIILDVYSRSQLQYEGRRSMSNRSCAIRRLYQFLTGEERQKSRDTIKHLKKYSESNCLTRNAWHSKRSLNMFCANRYNKQVNRCICLTASYLGAAKESGQTCLSRTSSWLDCVRTSLGQSVSQCCEATES